MLLWCGVSPIVRKNVPAYRAGSVRELSAFSTLFCCKPKTVLRNKVCYKQNKTKKIRGEGRQK